MVPQVVALEEVEESPEVSDILNSKEINWITKLKTEGADLTNMTDGGGGSCGLIPTDEQRKARSELCSGVNNPNYGKRH